MNNVDKQELYRSEKEEEVRSEFVKHFRECPIPDQDVLQNLGLFLNSKNLSRILFMNHLYQKIVGIQGIVAEFGCRWGQNVALFSAMRGMYEPFNRQRRILAFDTFTGFPSVDKDRDNSDCFIIREGGLSCTEGYEQYLDNILNCHEQDNPISHIKKYEILTGDSPTMLKQYLEKFPETIISLAYFDFDIYEPTVRCLELIKPHITKGTVLGFDELNDHDAPGETIALREVFGLSNIRIQRLPFVSRTSYVVIE